MRQGGGAGGAHRVDEMPEVMTPSTTESPGMMAAKLPLRSGLVYTRPLGITACLGSALLAP